MTDSTEDSSVTNSQAQLVIGSSANTLIGSTINHYSPESGSEYMTTSGSNELFYITDLDMAYWKKLYGKDYKTDEDGSIYYEIKISKNHLNNTSMIKKVDFSANEIDYENI